MKLCYPSLKAISIEKKQYFLINVHFHGTWVKFPANRLKGFRIYTSPIFMSPIVPIMIALRANWIHNRLLKIIPSEETRVICCP